MAFNPVQSFNEGNLAGQNLLKSQQQNQIRDLQNALAGQAGQGGFDATNNLDLHRLAAIDPSSAEKSRSAFANLSKERKKAYFLDAKEAQNRLLTGDIEGVERLLSDRKGDVLKLKGDTTQVDYMTNLLNTGQFEELQEGLAATVLRGQEEGLLSVPEIDKSKQTKLGTYNPGDYTVSSWSEFAKNGDPSILKRYEGDSKLRSIEIREQAQALKEEKHEIEKQKLEIDNRKKKIEAANEKRDFDQAEFLKQQEADTAISNIDSLLDNDLDLIYGGMEWAYPDKLRGQKGKNMMARRDQVGSTMSLMAAGKLKGQGTITDPERKMLAEAASILKNSDISASEARRELLRIKPIFEYFRTGKRPGAIPDEVADIKDPTLTLDQLKAMRAKLNDNNR